jgi:TPR repeat protein
VKPCLDELLAGCKAQKPEPCGEAGTLYEQGLAFANAYVLYRRACDLGLLAYCNDVGRLYERGDGVPKDPAAARRYYLRACAAGSASQVPCNVNGM